MTLSVILTKIHSFFGVREIENVSLSSRGWDPEVGLSFMHRFDYESISGKFHSHITVKISNQSEVSRLREFCKKRRVKFTEIDLSDFSGREQKDIMITKHFLTDGKDAVYKIIDDLDSLSKEATKEGFEVVRVKLEHESLPTISRFDSNNYREIHIKLRVRKDEYDWTMDFLKMYSKMYGYVPSKNPASDKGEFLSQFVNVRYYDGTLSDTDDKVTKLVRFLTENGILVEEVKSETAVFDTNLSLDSWWA